MKNHIANLSILARDLRETHDFQAAWELGEYTDKLNDAIQLSEFHYRTGNAVTDAVIHGAWLRAQQLNAAFTCMFAFPADNGIDTHDIAVILGNALDNALEALEKLRQQPGTGTRYLRLNSELRGGLYFITVENSFSAPLRLTAGEELPQTTKADPGSHGIGLSTIRSMAETYGGSMIFKAQQEASVGRFTLKVVLQRKPESRQV